MFKELGSFVITRQQWESYKAGEIWEDWLEKYPDLFDKKDRQYFTNQAVYGYGFFECLAIIFLYNATGYILILGNYGYSTQSRKNVLVKELVSDSTWEIIAYKGKTQPMPPDIFAYAPDRSDYFFCEVKGPGDRLRENQAKFFQLLQEVSGKPVYSIKYKFAPFSR